MKSGFSLQLVGLAGREAEGGTPEPGTSPGVLLTPRGTPGKALDLCSLSFPPVPSWWRRPHRSVGRGQEEELEVSTESQDPDPVITPGAAICLPTVDCTALGPAAPDGRHTAGLAFAGGWWGRWWPGFCGSVAGPASGGLLTNPPRLVCFSTPESRAPPWPVWLWAAGRGEDHCLAKARQAHAGILRSQVGGGDEQGTSGRLQGHQVGPGLQVDGEGCLLVAGGLGGGARPVATSPQRERGQSCWGMGSAAGAPWC